LVGIENYSREGKKAQQGGLKTAEGFRALTNADCTARYRRSLPLQHCTVTRVSAAPLAMSAHKNWTGENHLFFPAATDPTTSTPSAADAIGWISISAYPRLHAHVRLALRFL
jgi:hypothetical protein